MRRKDYERRRARELRAAGWSLGRIASRLEVSKSSVSVWVRGVPPKKPPIAWVRLPVIRGEFKECGRCRRQQPIELFNRHPSRGRQHWCRECFKSYFRGRGARHREQVNASKRRRRAAARAHVQAILEASACVECGETDVEVLDFDHVRGTKRAALSVLTYEGYPSAVLDAEIAKCEVVCANCHRRRTGIRQQSWRAIVCAGANPSAGLSPRRARNLVIVRAALEATGCVDCGNRDLLALEFDHLRDKSFGVTKGIFDECSVGRLLAEIAKCEVVCANCHRRRTKHRRRAAREAVDPT
jgi:hypothetical protein